MQSRRFAVRSTLTALLLAVMLAAAACAPLPALPAPTASALATTPANDAPLFTLTPVPAEPARPLATSAIMPTLSAPSPVEAVVTVTTPLTPTVPAATAPTPVVATTAPTTTTLVAPSWGAATYRDEAGGWEIDYPESWSLIDVAPEIKQESLGYSVTLTSWQPQEPGGQGIPEGGSKVDVGVMKGGAPSAEAAVEARRAEITAGDAGSRIVFEEPWDLPSGLSGVHWVIQPSRGEAVHEFVTAISGNRVVLSAFGDEVVFEQIVSTLRPMGGEARAKEVLVPMVAAGGSNDATAAAAAPLASTTYTVRAGDTLARIAARFGVSVQAILAANPQIRNPDRIYIGQRITIPTGGGQPPTPAPGATRVNIYMIGIGGGGVGCGDQVVPVRRDVPRTNAPLTAALNLLLSQKSQYYGESGLYNALYQSDLRIASITRSGSAWTINLVGALRIGGTCDSPRVKAQLEQTARQFSTVGSVRYFINGQPLDTVLSGR